MGTVRGDDCTLPLLHPLVQPGILQKQVDSWRNNPAVETLALSRQAASRGFSQRDPRASGNGHTWVTVSNLSKRQFPCFSHVQMTSSLNSRSTPWKTFPLQMNSNHVRRYTPARSPEVSTTLTRPATVQRTRRQSGDFTAPQQGCCAVLRYSTQDHQCRGSSRCRAGAPHRQSLIKKILYISISWRHFLNQGSLLSDNSSSHQS